MKVWIAHNGTPLTPLVLEDNPFTGGGEGSLYHIKTPDYEQSVAKIYHPKRRTQLRYDKIGYLHEHPPPSFDPQEQITLVWPKDILTDEQGNFLGFLVPLVEGEKLEILALPQLPKRYQAIWEAYDRDVPGHLNQRLDLCYKIARAIERLHQTEHYVVIDMKPDNIVVTAQGDVALVDLDSIEVVEEGETLYDAPVATPEYTPPDNYWTEQEVDPTQEEPWDRFGLAVIFYKVLLGIHPFAASTKGAYAQYTSLYQKIEQGLFVHNTEVQQHLSVVPPLHDRYHRLPIRVRQLFERTFTEGHSRPFARPSASEWVQVLREFRKEGGLDSQRLAIPSFPLQQLPARLSVAQLTELPTVTSISPTTKLQAEQPLNPKAVAKHALPTEVQDSKQIRSQRFFNFVFLLLLLVIGASLSLYIPWYVSVILSALGYLAFNYTTFKSRKSAERKQALQGVVQQQRTRFRELIQTAEHYEAQLHQALNQLKKMWDGPQQSQLKSALSSRQLLQDRIDTFQKELDGEQDRLRQLRKSERQKSIQLQQRYAQLVKEQCPLANLDLPTVRQQLHWLRRQHRLEQLAPEALTQYTENHEALEQLSLQYAIELEDLRCYYQEKSEDLFYHCREQHRELVEAVERYREQVPTSTADDFQNLLQQQKRILSQMEQWEFDLRNLEEPLQHQVAAYRDAKETAARYDQIHFGRHLLEMVGLKKPS